MKISDKSIAGFAQFDGTGRTWSSINGKKADPECPLQSLAVPESDHSTSWYMREYATNQDRWINDFVAVFDKMMANGYDSLEEEEVGDTRCSRSGGVSQCWDQQGELVDGEFLLLSQLDGRAVAGSCSTSNTVMRTRQDSSGLQRWRLRKNTNTDSFQLVNVRSGRLMNTGGISDYTWGLDQNSAGFSTLRAAGGVVWDVNTGGFLAASRGWTQKDGAAVNSWLENGALSQRFRLEPMADPATSISPCTF